MTKKKRARNDKKLIVVAEFISASGRGQAPTLRERVAKVLNEYFGC